MKNRIKQFSRTRVKISSSNGHVDTEIMKMLEIVIQYSQVHHQEAWPVAYHQEHPHNIWPVCIAEVYCRIYKLKYINRAKTMRMYYNIGCISL